MDTEGRFGALGVHRSARSWLPRGFGRSPCGVPADRSVATLTPVDNAEPARGHVVDGVPLRVSHAPPKRKIAHVQLNAAVELAGARGWPGVRGIPGEVRATASWRTTQPFSGLKSMYDEAGFTEGA